MTNFRWLTVLVCALVASTGCEVAAGLALGGPTLSTANSSAGHGGARGASGSSRVRGCGDEIDEITDDMDEAEAFDGDHISGCVGDGDEVDIYAIEVPNSDAGVTYRFDGRTTKSFLYMEIYDADHNYMRQAHLDNGGSGTIWATVAGGTIFYLKVKGFEGGDAYGYAIDVSSTEIDDPAEPNEEISDAVRIRLGQQVRAVMAPRLNDEQDGDLDWYALRLKKGGKLSVVLDKVAPDLSLSARVVDADGNHVAAESSSNRGANIRLKTRIRKRGVYYIAVTSPTAESYGDGKPRKFLDRPYRLQASLF